MDRSLFDGVLAVVRELGRCSTLDAVLPLVADAIVDVLGFDAAAINIATPDGDLRVDAVAGPPGVQELLNSRRSVTLWLALLDSAEEWGQLRFVSHTTDRDEIAEFPTWSAGGVVGSDADAWHPDDLLLAPMWDEHGELVGVLSVDQPRSGQHPDAEQRAVLEMFAAQVGKVVSETQGRLRSDVVRLELESRWQLTFEQSPAGAALVDVSGNIVLANRPWGSARLLTGRAGKDVVRADQPSR